MADSVKPIDNDPDNLQKTIADQDRIIRQLREKLTFKEEIIRILKLRQFGPRSEKSPGQGELFDEAESGDIDTPEVDQILPLPAVKPRAPRTKRGRQPLPPELDRVRIEHDVPEADKTCDCGCEQRLIGEDTSEQLDVIPASVRVLVHVRKKYACPCCETGVQIAALPPQPIPKSQASPGLLAHIITAKYQDGLPLYRQQTSLQRIGLGLNRNTLARWVIRCGELVQPLFNLMQDELLSQPYLHCDETTVQVLKEADRSASSKSYMWVRVSGLPDKKVVLFDYTPGRGGEYALQLLGGFQGYVQTDDYAGYNGVCSDPEMTQLGCWAHVRRKFVEAQKVVTSKGKKAKGGKAGIAINLIGGLYGIERQVRDEPSDKRYEVRQQYSVPQLDKLRRWMDAVRPKVLPKGALGRALAYMDKNWAKLTVFVEDGRLNIDNNPAENAIRPFVIGRKNWLFSDTPKGATASANLYSLIETAKANDVDPFAYLSRVFKELPAADTVEKIEALLPWKVDVRTIETSEAIE
jgi:transposase